MKKEFVITLVAAIIIAVLAIIGVIYGMATHEEPGLLAVCWDNDEACYADCSCTPEDEVIWPQGMPLSVITVDNDGRVYDEVPGPVLSAIGDINTQLGARFLEVGTSRASADIELIYRAAYDIDADSNVVDGALGYCRHFKSDRMRAIVAVRPSGNTRHEYRVTFHELAHALGLAHDEYESSIMYEHVWNDSEDERMSFTMLSSYDRHVLREAYGFED